MRRTLLTVACGIVFVFNASAADRPNIVIIMADDMGFSDIGCYGGEIHTPNLDQLAARGLRFTQFYNTGRCCPTRATLLTGLYAHQAGIGHMMEDRGHDGYRGDLNRNCVTIAEALKDAGYATYMSGKWHVTRFLDEEKHNWPLQRGFDRFYGMIHGGGSYFDPATLTDGNTRLPSPEGNYYFTDAISEHAAQYIREHDGDAPFFMYVAYTSPHWPLHALEDDIERYKGRYDGGWDALRAERLERMIKMGLINPKWKLTERDTRVKPWKEADHKAWQARRMEVYAAQIDRMDQGIGRIVEALRLTGNLRNTLVLFLADNGGCAEEIQAQWGGRHMTDETRDGRKVKRGNDPNVMPGPEDTYQSYGVPWANASNTPFRLYKHFNHEGGIATPLIAHWPASITDHGAMRRQPGHLIDLMATCVNLAGADYPAEFKGKPIHPMEGTSLAPAFDGKPLERETLFWEHEGNRAIRVGDWKLVARGDRGKWQLYNLAADRSETNDLAQVHPDRVQDMAAQWEAWAERANVFPWPYKPYERK